MSFLDDFKKLQLTAPRLAIINTNSENSAYTNYSTLPKLFSLMLPAKSVVCDPQ